MDRMESRLSFPLTGTPMTGLMVKEARTPGSAAERPAIAMNTSASEDASSSTLDGVLCADATAMSYGTPSFFRTASALSATARSLLLPRTMETFDIIARQLVADYKGMEWSGA